MIFSRPLLNPPPTTPRTIAFGRWHSAEETSRHGRPRANPPPTSRTRSTGSGRQFRGSPREFSHGAPHGHTWLAELAASKVEDSNDCKNVLDGRDEIVVGDRARDASPRYSPQHLRCSTAGKADILERNEVSERLNRPGWRATDAGVSTGRAGFGRGRSRRPHLATSQCSNASVSTWMPTRSRVLIAEGEDLQMHTGTAMVPIIAGIGEDYECHLNLCISDEEYRGRPLRKPYLSHRGDLLLHDTRPAISGNIWHAVASDPHGAIISSRPLAATTNIRPRGVSGGDTNGIGSPPWRAPTSDRRATAVTVASPRLERVAEVERVATSSVQPLGKQSIDTRRDPTPTQGALDFCYNSPDGKRGIEDDVTTNSKARPTVISSTTYAEPLKSRQSGDDGRIIHKSTQSYQVQVSASPHDETIEAATQTARLCLKVNAVTSVMSANPNALEKSCVTPSKCAVTEPTDGVETDRFGRRLGKDHSAEVPRSSAINTRSCPVRPVSAPLLPFERRSLDCDADFNNSTRSSQCAGATTSSLFFPSRMERYRQTSRGSDYLRAEALPPPRPSSARQSVGTLGLVMNTAMGMSDEAVRELLDEPTVGGPLYIFRESRMRLHGLSADGEKCMLTSKEGVVQWCRDMERMLRGRIRRNEGNAMITVNGHERFLDCGGTEGL